MRKNPKVVGQLVATAGFLLHKSATVLGLEAAILNHTLSYSYFSFGSYIGI
jgi:hypothetical protein